MGPISVVVQDSNNLTLEVTPTPSTTVILDRGIAGPVGPVGPGDVNGPASATDNALARFDGTTGKLIQNSVGVLSDAGILTGLGVQSRVSVIANATSITVNADTTDIATQANTQVAGTLTINAPTGTIVNGQKFILRLTSTNIQTFSWNAVFVGSTDIALPITSSGAGLTDYIGFIYNSASSKWQMIAKVFGFA
jgi:hypothetical protein